MSSSSAPATVDHSDADQSLSSCPHHAPRRIPLLSVSIALLVFKVCAWRFRPCVFSKIEILRKERAVKGGVMVKGLPGATFVSPGEDGTVIDVIDERSYVDGVKVARKCSKANVLGNAVETVHPSYEEART
ncbi:hypothetical protein JOM56_012278 [Amanita muscaria]